MDLTLGGRTIGLPDGWRVSSGLVDLQINGIGDAFPLADPSSLPALDEAVTEAGVTRWLLAVPSADPDDVEALARAADSYRRANATGLLGLHLEGPVLSPARPGAHPPEHLLAGDDARALRLLDLPGVRLVTLAPEVPGAMGYAARARERGSVVAAGHTDATFEQARAAIDEGITLCTHLFNAMAPVHHRAPGAALAYLTDERARVAFIADGEHLHAATEDLILRVAGERALLVSDAASVAGVAPARAAPAGVLAGSSATLSDAVERLAGRHGFDAVIGLATDAPAGVLGLSARDDATVWGPDGRVAGCVRDGEPAHANAELAALL